MSSPGVQVQDIQRQHYIPSVSSEVAVFVGQFERGPINVPIFITNVNQFKFIFGRGVDIHYNDWYQIYNYLQYSSGVWVARSCGAVRTNANNTSEDFTIDQYSDWDTQYSTIPVNNYHPIRFIARTPGSWGNTLSIGLIGKTEYDNNEEIISGIFAQDIFGFFETGHYGICVFKSGALVETFYKTIDTVEDLNTESLYLYVKSNTVGYDPILEIEDFELRYGTLDMGYLGVTDTVSDLGFITTIDVPSIDLNLITDTQGLTIDDYLAYGDSLIQLANGTHTASTLTELAETYELFENPDSFDIDIIIGNETANNLAINLAETRRDCIAFIGIPTDTALENVDAYISSLSESMFAHFTLNIKSQYDYFTDKFKLINISGDTAGLKAAASLTDPWTVGAGLARGQIKNVKNMHMVLSKLQKENYYKQGINFIENRALITQKTFLSSNSNYSRVHIRSLFNHIEKEVKYILRNIVHEHNTLRTRQNACVHIKRYLKDIKVGNGIEAARVNIYPGSADEVIVEIEIKPRYVTENINIRITNAGTETLSTIVS